MARLWDYIRLPREISDFESRYLARMNRIALWCLWCHLPVFTLVAAANGTGAVAAAVLTSLVLAGPSLAMRLASPRHISIVHGFTSMCLGALLVHFGQGMVQIEMHFYFFVLIALLAVFANPVVIIVAAVTVALHHGLFWALLPQSVFNYAAPWWVVALHALFVIVESVAACFVARSFFDNVIGLERIVRARTAEVEAKNRDMRVILDAVDQGLVTIYRDGSMSAERSTALTRWFGSPVAGETFFAWTARADANMAHWLQVCLDAVFDGVLPPEVTLAQMPRRLQVGQHMLELNTRLLLNGQAVLMVFSDVTATVAAENAAASRRELVVTVERLLQDREGVVEFVDDVSKLVQALPLALTGPLVDFQRTLHTIKGNAGLFGLQRLVGACHTLETEIQTEGRAPAPERMRPILEQWQQFRERIQPFLDVHDRFDVREDDLVSLYEACEAGATVPQLLTLVESWRRESADRRLQRLGEQARVLADKLHKPLGIHVDAQRGLRVPHGLHAVWSALVHVVRNAVDHGIETAEERRVAAKSAVGTLSLRCHKIEEQLVVEIEDDGRGVDWSKVAECARVRGLPAATREDLVDALFADGFSTAAQVTEYSGRGVGMGAVRHAAAVHGGTVSVRSEPGRGTCVTLRLPASVFVDGLQELAAHAT